MITLYHNTSNENAVKINKEGIKCGLRRDVYGKGSEAEGSGIWCSVIRGYGYGGATITFNIDEKDENLTKQNDTEYIVYRDIKPDEIVDIDLVVSMLAVNKLPRTVESTIPLAMEKYGKEKLLYVFKKYEHNFVEPYNYERFVQLVETGKKYCKGTIQSNESKKVTEGIHLYGFVTDEDGNSKVLEDNDYSDKNSYKRDLRANGYKVKSVKDNRDMYVLDNSDYLSVDNVKTQIHKLQKDLKYNKENGYSTLVKEVEQRIEELKELLDKASKISLTESLITESGNGEDVRDLYYQIKSMNPHAKWDFYKGKSRGTVLSILTNMQNHPERYTKPTKKQSVNKNKVTIKPDKVSKDYTDNMDELEDIDNKQHKSFDILEKELDESISVTDKSNKAFVLKGIEDGTSFDITYGSKRDKLEDLKVEFEKTNPNITMWVDENDDIPNMNHKLEEVSRNELLVKTKGETISRYNRAAGYKGFSIVNIDTTDLLRGNTLIVTCRVGKYNDVIQLEDMLYWIQIVAEEKSPYNEVGQITTKGVTKAIMNSVDGMDIKIDCECGDFCYRFAYQATVWGYKYGKPENRPAPIRNPDGFGALCKHLTAILSNKRWMQQITKTLMDWIVEHIDEVNDFLKLKDDKRLTLPNELARQNAKLAWKNKQDKEQQEDKETEQNNEEELQDVDTVDKDVDNTNNEETELEDMDKE